ncbi:MULTISPECIES: hypothetical protein [Pectobacterium]|uniref:hypothetical protein n=1 Tax=Pectobacterium TaxID=122277 RepID=UPI0004E60D66|nr:MULTISPECIES: hypothetical protein [Pectobacterium]AVT57989.1 hypothetical protein OA04_13780 [Pectobacterium versatile]KFF72091.1 hypothetical protein IW01_05585 [Pectobacterium brasiliense]
MQLLINIINIAGISGALIGVLISIYAYLKAKKSFKKSINEYNSIKEKMNDEYINRVHKMRIINNIKFSEPLYKTYILQQEKTLKDNEQELALLLNELKSIEVILCDESRLTDSADKITKVKSVLDSIKKIESHSNACKV